MLAGLESTNRRGAALDIGCGSGRHCATLIERNWSPVVGVDVSETAIRACQSTFPDANFHRVSEDGLLPFADDSFNLVVSWGILHYNSAEVRERMVLEAARVLADQGTFTGTLRARGESHVQGNADLDSATVTLFDMEEADALLAAGGFATRRWGYMERSPIGEPQRRICHWIFECSR